jgi:uncharacterized protein YbgA (DUF1722 family)/uncharacterized protein YbbK (DUF523 family)
MRDFPRPRLAASKCLGFAACRYNGAIKTDAFVMKLAEFAEVLPVCPEMEIGLGVPRDPIRVVRGTGGLKLMQPTTGRDLTAEMETFCAAYVGNAADFDGFILKEKSPSCGLSRVKIHKDLTREGAVAKGAGFFGGALRQAFPSHPLEDEGRLRNFTIREHFLTAIFALADFRMMRENPAMRKLVDYQSRYKYLLMAYNRKELKLLGKITANSAPLPVEEVFADYENHLRAALGKTPRFTSLINVLQHMAGHFSRLLNAREKKMFAEILEEYRAGQVPLSVPREILHSWVVRFDESYLAAQAFFEPYPRALTEISDSGKGRDY